MADAQDKENVAPTSSDPLQRKDTSPTKKATKKGRSKSIGPGDSLDVLDTAKENAKNRRKSAFTPASRAIITSEAEKKERQAARRKTLANRRVSFAPEATLHTWDILLYPRDQTSSTDASEQTRRASGVTRAAGGGTPFPSSPAVASSDAAEPPSTPPEQEDEPKQLPASPAPQRDLHRKQRRRSSADANSPDDLDSSGISGSSEASGSDEEDEEDGDESEDATGTAMSLDVEEETARSFGSTSSTSSSLTQRLRQAADAAGTRGIEYDEYGDQSMEIAGDTVTNAFKPWAQGGVAQPANSASLDQENINPFSPAFKAQIASGLVTRPATIDEETEEMSMDITRAVGGIKAQQRAEAALAASSPLGDATMEMTQAIGKIQSHAQQSPTSRAGQKRRRSMATTEAGSPGAEAPQQLKRSRRSSVARSSMGDDTMDLTVAIGGIQSAGSPAKTDRRRSVARRRSSGVASEPEEATMDFTQAVGGIKRALTTGSEHTSASLDSNEELTMELTTVLGGIKAAEKAAAAVEASPVARPVTPQKAQSPARNAANTTPKDQERFKEAPDSGPKKLLTPLFQKQVVHSAEKASSEKARRRKTISPAPVSWTGPVFDETLIPKEDVKARFQTIDEDELAAEAPVSYPELPSAEQPVTPQTVQDQLDAQLEGAQPSPTVQKMPRSSPVKSATPVSQKTPERTPQKTPQQTPTPRKLTPSQGAMQEPSQEARSTLADSIRLMSTPRKETVKTVTPKKSALKPASPVKAMTPRARPTPKGRAQTKTSPARQLSHELLNLSSDEPMPKVQLQDFLEEAGIRFMDLTATKRRLTTAPTPSKARKNTSVGTEEGEAEVNLESAIVSAACTQPEHDMFQHACHELKHYISEGKKVIKQLETETYNDTPPLLQAYMQAPSDRKAELDALMRDMKTHARLRSKEMWYAWRSQLLEDLMKGLSGIGEGLLKDDEVLQNAERVLEQVLPGLEERYESLQQEAERLEQAAAATSEDEKEELETARARLMEIDEEVEEKKRMLEELQREAQEQEQLASDLQEQKVEFSAAIREADRVREACRGVSLTEINTLKESIKHLEETYGWSIASASSSPPTVTMTYKTQLQLFFHPAAFKVPTQSAKSRPNAPISLSYIAQDRDQRPKELTTTLRFFLQLLRASLQALPQCTTRLPDLLGLVSGGWDTALAVAESERRLGIETLTSSRIVSDERLAIESTVLLPKVRTKIRVSHELLAAVGEGLQLSTTLETSVKVIYGEQYNETKMTKFVNDRVSETDGWNNAVRELRERLVAQGMKGFRK